VTLVTLVAACCSLLLFDALVAQQQEGNKSATEISGKKPLGNLKNGQKGIMVGSPAPYKGRYEGYHFLKHVR